MNTRFESQRRKLLVAIEASALSVKSCYFVARNRAPADMILGILIVIVAGVWLVFGLNQCGRHDYGSLEHALAGAPK